MLHCAITKLKCQDSSPAMPASFPGSLGREPGNEATAMQWRSEGRAWPGTCPAKVHLARVCASASVASAMVKLTASARPIPMTWLHHCSYA